MGTQTFRFSLAASIAALLTGCGDVPLEHDCDDEPTLDVVSGWNVKSQSLASPGRWQIPADVMAVGDQQNVQFNGAPPYDGGANCSGGATAGALTMRNALLGFFPQINTIGVYNCRVIAGSNSMSLHGVGRALDIMIPTTGGQADNGAGDPIAHWLIENAQALGVQTIIWDRTIWRVSNSPRQHEYTGSNPHIDHLHVEININAGNEGPAWYDNPFGPTLCDPLAPETTIVDENHACFSLFGPSQYWRQQTGAGDGGSLYWTNAFENDTPSNWARWALPFEEPGDYGIEVYVDGAWGVFAQTRYTVTAGGVSFPVVVDQSAADGWLSLGTFSFLADGSESVVVEDSFPGPVGDEQRVVVDALRVTPVAVAGCVALPAEGGIVDENSACFDLHGPAQYWRAESGAGHAGALLWTNAFENDTPSNWAEWRVPVAESAEYVIEAYIDAAHGQFVNTRYEVETGAGTEAVVVDQSQASGWTALGTFALAAGADTRVAVFDNHPGAVGAEMRIAVDALRLVRADAVTPPVDEPPADDPPADDPPVDDPPVDDPPADDPPVDDPPADEPPLDDPNDVLDADEEPSHQEVGRISLASADAGGCSSSGVSAVSPLAFLLLLLGLRRRRLSR